MGNQAKTQVQGFPKKKKKIDDDMHKIKEQKKIKVGKQEKLD